MAEINDLIIIGGGPAGLTAAQYAGRSNLKVLLFEELSPGGQAIIIDGLENYPGFPEAVSGFDFSQKMEKQARKFGCEILNTGVSGVSRISEEEGFLVETTSGEFKSRAIILSTGAKHRHLNIPGEKEFSGKGVSYCATCDGPFFRDKKILVVGGGDAACDEAMYLSNLSDKIIMIHRKERFRAQKAIAERIIKNKNITVRFNTILKEIKGNDKVETAVLEKTDSKENYNENFDAVFIFIGSIPQTALFPDLKKDEGGYLITDQNMATEVPGLFVAGDVRATPFRQIVVAAGEGAIAANSVSKYIDKLKGQVYT